MPKLMLHKQLNDLNFMIQGVEIKLNYNRPGDTYTSNLTLTGVQLNSSGTYRCQVTYINQTELRLVMLSESFQLTGKQFLKTYLYYPWIIGSKFMILSY